MRSERAPRDPRVPQGTFRSAFGVRLEIWRPRVRSERAFGVRSVAGLARNAAFGPVRSAPVRKLSGGAFETHAFEMPSKLVPAGAHLCQQWSVSPAKQSDILMARLVFLQWTHQLPMFGGATP